MPVIAVIGASSDRHKFGNKALRAFRKQGFTVVPINPHEREVEGERAYPSVLDYPDPIDEATFYVQPEVGVAVMADVARKGIKTVWLRSEERRVGKECMVQCRSRWSPYH